MKRFISITLKLGLPLALMIIARFSMETEVFIKGDTWDSRLLYGFPFPYVYCPIAHSAGYRWHLLPLLLNIICIAPITGAIAFLITKPIKKLNVNYVSLFLWGMVCVIWWNHMSNFNTGGVWFLPTNFGFINYEYVIEHSFHFFRL